MSSRFRSLPRPLPTVSLRVPAAVLSLAALAAPGAAQDVDRATHGDEAATPQLSLEERTGSFVLRQYQLGCLSQLTYLLGSGKEAVVVDPQRDVEHYLRDAKELGLEIRYVLLTHTNADLDTFVYAASHDLKAPIANLEGLLHALRDYLPSEAAAPEPMVPHLVDLMQAAIDQSQEKVTGDVRLKLYKGNCDVVGRRADVHFNLYSQDVVTFEDDAGSYNQRDAEGFINLNALRLKLLGKRGN